MHTRIRSVTVRPIRLTPTEAELAIDVLCSELHTTSELRGRLMGPICPYSTTIEVAYPIHSRAHGHGKPVLHAQCIIPEPAWWDAESPFLYHGPIELWEHESRVESLSLRCGLRHAQWAGEQLIWNGRPVELRSRAITEFEETDLRLLRNRGFNGIIVPAASAKSAWMIADRIGLLVVTEPPLEIDPLLHPSAVPAKTL